MVVRPIFETPTGGVGFGASFTGPKSGRETSYRCKTPSNGSGSTSVVFKYNPTFTLPFSTQAPAKKKNDLRFYCRRLGKRQKVATIPADSKKKNHIVLKISDTASSPIHELKRNSAEDQKICESLFGLRAASEWSIDIQRSQSEDSENTETSGAKLRKVVGDMGLTFFSPIDIEFLPICVRNVDVDDKVYELKSVTEEVNALEIEDYPVNLDPEPASALAACPRILTANMIHQLMEEALPMSLKTTRWDRIYALGRDGDDFYTMTRNCANFKDTIIVAVTSQGHILGGYAAAPWVKQEGHDMCRSFYGNGESFLFASHPAEEQQEPTDVPEPEKQETEATSQPEKKNEHNVKRENLHIYKWTGSNTYSQVCDVDDGQLAMGGGGAFGLIIEDNFSRGTTGRCSTFGNPPLVPTPRGIFEIVDFEVYGFTSLGAALKSEAEPPTKEHPKVVKQDSY